MLLLYIIVVIAVVAKAVVAKAVVAQADLAIKLSERLFLLKKNDSLYISCSTPHETLFYELTGISSYLIVNI